MELQQNEVQMFTFNNTICLESTGTFTYLRISRFEVSVTAQPDLTLVPRVSNQQQRYMKGKKLRELTVRWFRLNFEISITCC